MIPHATIQDRYSDFDTQADMYYSHVHQCCRSMGLKDHEIEDIAGNALAKAYGGLSSYLGQANLKTWLWTITRNEVYSYYRKQRTSAKASKTDFCLRETPPTPCDICIQNELSHQLHTAISQLPQAWAEIVRMYYWQHQPTRTIAQQLNCSDQLVRTTLFRARKQLKLELAS